MHEQSSGEKSPRITRLKIESWISPREDEFFQRLKQHLEHEGIPTTGVVFSGFDANSFLQPLADGPKEKMIYVMDEAGWLDTTLNPTNPAEYALDHSNPCIGVYDANQLVRLDDLDIEVADGGLGEITEVKAIKMGKKLMDLEPGASVSDPVAHVNYPPQAPRDALLCLVYIEN